MDEINQLCHVLTFREKELRRLNRIIRDMENYCEHRSRYEPEFSKIDVSDYKAIRDKLKNEVQTLIDRLNSL